MHSVNKKRQATRNIFQQRMKSIKEASVAYGREHNGTVNIEDFEAGANYVLEEIERIVNSAIENKSMTIPTWRLNFIIKQLKK